MQVEEDRSDAGHGWEREALQTLLAEHQQDRRSARRWRWFKAMVWMLVLVGMIALTWKAVEDSQPSAVMSGKHTAVISIDGTIAAGSPSSAENVIDSLQEAFEAPQAQAVVLLFNSPGGSPVHAGMVYDEIIRLKAIHQKPVYAVVEEMCASAAYYIAAAADEIYVDKASVVGSIGVLMNGFGFTGLMDKLGIERRLITAGENKGFMDPFSPQTEAQRQHADELLKSIHQQFISAVKQGRGARLGDVPELFSGLIWTGEKAVELGLADGLGSLRYVARELVLAEDLVDYTRQESFQERVAKQLGATVIQGLFESTQERNWVWR